VLTDEPAAEDAVAESSLGPDLRAAAARGAVLIAAGTASEVTAQVVWAMAQRARSDEPSPRSWLLVPMGVEPSRALTPREGQVLLMVREGLTNKEIARGLGVTVHTANRHVSNILRKLHARNRAEAVHRFE
jgi:DNA-binding NarL/FixJ family response regulator